MANISNLTILSKIDKIRKIILNDNSPHKSTTHITLLSFEFDRQHPESSFFENPDFHRVVATIYNKTFVHEKGVLEQSGYDLLKGGFFAKIFKETKIINRFRLMFYKYINNRFNGIIIKKENENYSILVNNQPLLSVKEHSFIGGIWKPHISLFNLADIEQHNGSLFNNLSTGNKKNKLTNVVKPIDSPQKIDMNRDIGKIQISVGKSDYFQPILDRPVMIHIVGHEHGGEGMKRRYLCTVLRAIYTFKRLGVAPDRMYIIYGDAVPNKKVCETMDKYTIDKGFIGEDLPKNVNTIYVNASYNFAKIISYILRYVCTDRTPIIFGYDGHGLCEYNHPKNGVMNIYGNQWLTDSILFSLFKDTDRLNNRKLFLWTQCCGYDFVERIKDKIVGFHLRGSTGCNELSYGSSVMREFNKLKKLGLSIQEYMDRSTYGYVFSDTTISKNEKILDYLNLKLTPVEKKIIW